MTNRTRSAHRIAAATAAVAAGVLLLAACASNQPDGSAGAPGGSTSSAAAPSSLSSSPAESGPVESSPVESTAVPGPSGGSTTDLSSAPGSSAGSPAPDGLAGYLFTAKAATGRMLVDGKPPTIAFHRPGEVALNAGCNGMGGLPVFDGSNFKVDKIMSTMMACIDPADGTSVMDQENWFRNWLTAGVSWKLSGTDLVLSADGVTVTFARTGSAADPAAVASTAESHPSVPAEHTAITAPTVGAITPLSTVPPARPSPGGVPIPTPPPNK